ncbi:MAG: hypothetical protein ABJA11_05975 [Pseudolysinimonas sp.]
MNRLAWFVAISAVIVLLTGCSSHALASDPLKTTGVTAVAAAPSAPASRAVTACSLVTEAEAAAALGSDAGAGTATVVGSNSSCKFGNYPTLLTINLVSVTGKTDFDHLKGQVTGGTLVAVSGLGDDAFAVTEGPAASFWFTHGTAMVAIVLVLRSGSNPNDAALTVAHEADGRL